MVIPVSLATFRGVLVCVGGQTHILPTLNVEKAVRMKKEEIKTVENRETVLLDGQVLFVCSGPGIGRKADGLSGR